MTDSSIVRNRTAYGETCRDIVKCLFGLGISPGRIEMVRKDTRSGERVRFDIIVDRHHKFFAEKTTDELRQIIDGIEKAKEVFQKGDLDLDRLFRVPANGHIHDVIARSFHDKGLAEYVIPSANSNVRDHGAPAQIAASATRAPERQKNPNRVAAGKANSAKRYRRDPGVAVPQVTTSAMGGHNPPAPAPEAEKVQDRGPGRLPKRVADRMAQRRRSRS